jgi:DNA uptake protein ComE-like DNA-binding protein
MKNNIDFHLSKRNRRGIIILSFITLLFIYFPRLYFYCQPKEEISIESFPSEKWKKEHKNYSKFEYSNSDYKKNKSKFLKPTHKFDPNLYTLENWKSLGLSEKQASVVLKFTKRKIYSNEDLKKIFVISDELYLLIKDSTFYPIRENKQFISLEENAVKSHKTVILELNSASEEDLINLKGIGTFFAKQIIKKRIELRGFISKEQLLEVWKMDQEKYDLLIGQIEVNPELINKIHLNSITIDELKVHPYIRWNIANSIIKMRNQKNGFKSIDEIKESVLIDEELFKKLKPYLSL